MSKSLSLGRRLRDIEQMELHFEIFVEYVLGHDIIQEVGDAHSGTALR